MTDHEAELATLHQEAEQQRARIKRLEAALRTISGFNLGTKADLKWIAREALQESSK